MEKTIVKFIKAYDGSVIIDGTEQAERRVAAMDYIEERYRRECRREARRRRELAKNPIWRMVALCGIV